MTDRGSFGPSLRCERERRGITLAQIADQTKISASLFAAMERNDLSRWPKGIFRRSFIKGYAQAIGLDPEPIVEAFGRLFPEEGDPPPDGAADARTPPVSDAADDAELLDSDPASTPHARLRPQPESRLRVAAAAIDAGVALMIGLAAGLAGGMTAFWAGVAVGSLGPQLVSTLAVGSTFGIWLLCRDTMPVPSPAAAPAARVRRRVSTRPPVLAQREVGYRRAKRNRFST